MISAPDAPRCYTVPQLLEKLEMTHTTFYRLRQARALPFLEELRPRLGRRVRYRADLVDQYLRGEWTQQAPGFGRRRAG